MQAMKARETAEGQRRRLEDLRAQMEERRSAAGVLVKRGRSTLAGGKAARELMVRQTGHLVAAVQKLEVPCLFCNNLTRSFRP